MDVRYSTDDIFAHLTPHHEHDQRFLTRLIQVFSLGGEIELRANGKEPMVFCLDGPGEHINPSSS